MRSAPDLDDDQPKYDGEQCSVVEQRENEWDLDDVNREGDTKNVTSERKN